MSESLNLRKKSGKLLQKNGTKKAQFKLIWLFSERHLETHFINNIYNCAKEILKILIFSRTINGCPMRWPSTNLQISADFRMKIEKFHVFSSLWLLALKLCAAIFEFFVFCPVPDLLQTLATMYQNLIVNRRYGLKNVISKIGAYSLECSIL